MMNLIVSSVTLTKTTMGKSACNNYWRFTSSWSRKFKPNNDDFITIYFIRINKVLLTILYGGRQFKDVVQEDGAVAGFPFFLLVKILIQSNCIIWTNRIKSKFKCLSVKMICYNFLDNVQELILYIYPFHVQSTRGFWTDSSPRGSPADLSLLLDGEI